MILWSMLILILAPLVWLLLSPRVNTRLYHHCLFKPDKERGDKAEFGKLVQQCTGRELWFKNRRGNRLHAWLLGNATQSPYVLFYCMGKDGDIARRAQVFSGLLQAGIAIFVFEYAGYGESEGRPSLSGMSDDTVDAFDFIVNNLSFDAKQIVLYGESLGAAMQAQLLLQRTPAGIVLKSAFASLESIAKELVFPLRLYPAALFPVPRLDTCATLAKSRVPVLIVHGSGDRLARKHHAVALYDAANEPRQLLWLPDSRHAYTPPADESRLREGLRLFVLSLKGSVTRQQQAC